VPFTLLGSDHVAEQLDWLVIVRVRADCPRRYRRACSCRVPATMTAPGPPKAIGKGLVSNAFIAMLLTERYVAGRSQNSLVTGLARQGADISPSTLTGTCAAAGALLAPLEDAVTARSRESWHLHADETSWRVFAPEEGDGPAKWWLWVFIGPDTTCFVMDPARSGRCWPATPASMRRPGSWLRLRTAGRGGWWSPATSTPFTPRPGRRQTA
jgi:transposase